MYQVPTHIKAHVRRIVREYELLLHQGHIIALQISEKNKIYFGLETTKRYLNAAIHFRELLDTQEDYLASKTEEEFRKKVYEKICEFYKPLSEKAILRINNSTECQAQLEAALRTAKRRSSSCSDAKFLTSFISNACTLNWCSEDKDVQRKSFKLIKSEKDFENLLSNEKHPAIEITETGNFPYTHFRIALQTFDIEDIYRKRAKLHSYREFWDGVHNVEEFDTDLKIFNLWNNVAKIGIYYVYIPKK